MSVNDDRYPRLVSRPDCPYCGYDKAWLSGQRPNGLTQYQCRACGKKFTVMGEQWKSPEFRSEYLRRMQTAKGRGEKATLVCPMCQKSFTRYKSGVRVEEPCCSNRCARRKTLAKCPGLQKNQSGYKEDSPTRVQS